MILKVYTLKQIPADFEFYILSKGKNSGKPLTEACPNCFVCRCSNQEEKDFYFWLLFGLWKANYFAPFLTGSVIEFLRLGCLKGIIEKQTTAVKPNTSSFRASVEKVKLIEEKEKNILQQLQLMRQLKIMLIRQHLK